MIIQAVLNNSGDSSPCVGTSTFVQKSLEPCNGVLVNSPLFLVSSLISGFGVSYAISHEHVS